MRKHIAKIRAPRGFSFIIKKFYYDKVVITLRDKFREAGHISLVIEGKWVETHSMLDEYYHGRGFGVLMYARAIQWGLENGYKVRSSGASSFEAQRVWRGKRIRQKFAIRTKKGYSLVGSTKMMQPDCDTFFAYPK